MKHLSTITNRNEVFVNTKGYAWIQLKEVRGARRRVVVRKVSSKPFSNYSVDTVREGLMDVLMALDACANFGSDIQFEISPRNVRAVHGKLILVDCFFLVSKLQEVRSSRW